MGPYKAQSTLDPSILSSNLKRSSDYYQNRRALNEILINITFFEKNAKNVNIFCNTYMKLSYYINLILELEEVNLLNEQENSLIDSFDNSILILDDINDQSLTRDGEKCFYITHGIKVTKNEAKKLKIKAFNELNNICNRRNIKLCKKLQAKFLLKKLDKKIKIGQNIDLSLQKIKKVSISMESKYDNMIRLFTGGHIKYGFLLGYLISKKNPTYKKEVVSIGEEIGVIRQIYDDLNDYENNKHHEPLGDIVNHKKRLPELLFLLNATHTQKEELIFLLKDPTHNLLEIKNLVLNSKVKKLIHEKISNIELLIESKMYNLPEKYKIVFKNLLKKFN